MKNLPMFNEIWYRLNTFLLGCYITPIYVVVFGHLMFIMCRDNVHFIMKSIMMEKSQSLFTSILLTGCRFYGMIVEVNHYGSLITISCRILQPFHAVRNVVPQGILSFR